MKFLDPVGASLGDMVEVEMKVTTAQEQSYDSAYVTACKKSGW